MISKEEVNRIAKLARLELTEKEIEKMQKDMSAILDYFDLLKKAPKPTAVKNTNAVEDARGLRADELKERDHSEVERIVALAPDQKDDFIKVKNVL